MPKRVSAAVSRPTRTIGQGGAGLATAELLDTFLDLSQAQVFLIALLLTPFYSWVQALVENRLGVGILRDVPPRTDPVVDAG